MISGTHYTLSPTKVILFLQALEWSPGGASGEESRVRRILYGKRETAVGMPERRRDG